MSLKDLLTDLQMKNKDEISSTPEVVEGGDDLDVDKLPIEARRWTRMDDVVVVVADLKNSTKLGTGSRASSTAGIYEAATGGVVQIFNAFDADFLQIQGDGAFAIFWGESRYERALCAGITVKTNSEDLVARIASKWPDKPETGFKVGVASGRVLVKRVGTPRNPAQQEPVWAGKPVNFATKAAQAADLNELIVAGSVWDQIENNDFLTLTCPCGDGPSDSLWGDFEIEKLPDDDPERHGRCLTSKWCDVHGEEYCEAVLDGKKRRSEVGKIREEMQRAQMRNAIREIARQKRENLRHRNRRRRK